MTDHNEPQASEYAPPPLSTPEGSEDPESTWIRLFVLIAALVGLTYLTGWWGLLMVFGIVLMIFLHELGHFIMAKRAGMKVTEFFIGFGPRIWSFRRGETEYGLKVIPAGAYVRIIGMNAVEQVDPADESRTYRVMPFWQRLGVAVAGSTMHFIQALLLIFVLLVGFGQPGGALVSPTPNSSTPWLVGDVFTSCPGEQAGLRTNDQIIAIDGKPMNETAVQDAVRGKGDENISIAVRREGKDFTVHPRLMSRTIDGESVGVLGITFGQNGPPTKRLSPISAVPQTFREFGSVVNLSMAGLVHVFSPSSLSNYGNQVTHAWSDRRKAKVDRSIVAADSTTVPSSPKPGASPHSKAAELNSKKCLATMAARGGGSSKSDSSRITSILGIFNIGTALGQSSGLVAILGIFVFLNIFIGIFNLLPMLPLDGGHVVIAGYEKIREWGSRRGGRYYADVTKLMPVIYVVIALLAVMFVSSLYLDAVNPISVK